ncbi:MAG: endonuclease/exonuclease/phosphatase family protein [Gammaproteobacteria bacterium]|nr:endonuclease/exonuclease/phosphatase family protein [Gammaproteobacteria bacterium]
MRSATLPRLLTTSLVLAALLAGCVDDGRDAAAAPPGATPAPAASIASAAPAAPDAPDAPAGGTLRIATWNMEWLVAPNAFRKLAAECVPQGASPGPRRRYIPCDVAADKERSEADYRAIARYVRLLRADIVALQEVDGVEAARRVFDDHDFCFTRREAVQNNGFAIRKGVPHRCGPDFVPLSLDGRVRRGAELIVYPGEAREFRLLSVHLKSGCARPPLDTPREPCAVLARQVPELERWIDAQAAAGRRFAVLGDFNHDLLGGRGPARNEAGQVRDLWTEIDDGDPPGARLVDVAFGQRFRNCHPGQNHRAYIDHVVLGEKLAAWRLPGSFVRLTYDPGEALQRKLPDHCPVGVDLRPVG